MWDELQQHANRQSEYLNEINRKFFEVLNTDDKIIESVEIKTVVDKKENLLNLKQSPQKSKKNSRKNDTNDTDAEWKVISSHEKIVITFFNLVYYYQLVAKKLNSITRMASFDRNNNIILTTTNWEQFLANIDLDLNKASNMEEKQQNESSTNSMEDDENTATNDATSTASSSTISINSKSGNSTFCTSILVIGLFCVFGAIGGMEIGSQLHQKWANVEGAGIGFAATAAVCIIVYYLLRKYCCGQTCQDIGEYDETDSSARQQP